MRWWFRRKADEKHIDETVLARLQRLGGEDLVRQMIDLFLENAPKRIDAALEGARAHDLQAVERATHSLKTTAGNLGARQLQDLAGRIEQLAAEQAVSEVASLLRELRRAYPPVKSRLQKERKALT